jgi:hypothetical protein
VGINPQMAARTASTHLAELLAERRAALCGPLGHNSAYMADLEAEIEHCRRALVIAEVTERALRRAVAAGRLHG